jgi:hypothetical protein
MESITEKQINDNTKNIQNEIVTTNFIPINNSNSKLFDNFNIHYNKYKKYIIIISIVFIIFLLFKYNIITCSFTNFTIYNNIINKDKFNNQNDNNKLISNNNEWNLENEIEKIIKNQNIYIQEKKL